MASRTAGVDGRGEGEGVCALGRGRRGLVEEIAASERELRVAVTARTEVCVSACVSVSACVPVRVCVLVTHACVRVRVRGCNQCTGAFCMAVARCSVCATRSLRCVRAHPCAAAFFHQSIAAFKSALPLLHTPTHARTDLRTRTHTCSQSTLRVYRRASATVAAAKQGAAQKSRPTQKQTNRGSAARLCRFGARCGGAPRYSTGS